MTTRSRTLVAAAAFATVTIAAAACSDPLDLDHFVAAPTTGTINGAINHAMLVQAHDSFAVFVGTVGPGEYHEPSISKDGVQFTGITSPDYVLPSGILQIFHFNAVRAGTYILTFPHAGGEDPKGYTLVDTVVVQ